MKKETEKKKKQDKKESKEQISDKDEKSREESKQDKEPAPEGVPSDEGKKETSELESPRDDSGEPEIKDAESSLDKNQFQEFAQQSSPDITQPFTESFSPVLKRVEAPQQITDLEQNVASTRLSIGETEDTAQTRYTPTRPSEDYTARPERDDETYTEPGKIDEDFSAMQPAPINIETAGRDLHPKLRGVTPVNLELWEVRKPHGTLEEKYIQPEKIDVEKVGRETPFETRIKGVEKKKSEYEIK